MIRVAILLFGLAVVSTIAGLLWCGIPLQMLGYVLAVLGALALGFQMISGGNS